MEDKITKADLISLTFIWAESEDTEIIPAMIEVMTEAEEILDRGYKIETVGCILNSELGVDITMIQEGHMEDKTTIEMVCQ